MIELSIITLRMRCSKVYLFIFDKFNHKRTYKKAHKTLSLDLFLNVGEEGVASVAGGRRGDLWVVIEFLLELPLLPFPLREALIWTPLKLHRMDERITRRGRRRRR